MNDSSKAGAPAFSFAGRHEVKKENIAPSPNSYNTAGLTSKGRLEIVQGIFKCCVRVVQECVFGLVV